MRLPSTLSTLLMAALGLCVMLGCRQPLSPSADATAASPATSPAASPAATDASPTAQNSSSTAATETPSIEAVPPEIFTEESIAIRGADVVAYFTESRYVSGSADYTHEWANATWHFSSPENRDLFAANPEQYAPQYGGFCAWAVAEGYTASVDPNAWEIVDGKLYLNYDARIQRRWQRDIPGNIARANENWPAVLN